MTATATATATCGACDARDAQLRALQLENDALRQQLAQLQRRRVDPAPAPAPADPALSLMTRTELQRYGRQMLVGEFGMERQLRLRRARVLVLGVGGLGSPVALYLAAMGVGHLVLVDDDHVERSNLHRQVAHDESTLGELKVHSAQRRIVALNPDTHVEAIAARFTATNALALVTRVDVVVDASDNVTTRYLANDACAAVGKPLVSGSALGLEGQVTVFALDDDKQQGGCYRCLYPQPLPAAASMSCAENGVLGVVPGVIGCLQAVETVKVITGLGTPLVGTQCFYDAYDGQFRHLKIGNRRKSDCLACSPSARFAMQLRTEELVCTADEPPPVLAPANRISIQDFAALRSATKNYVLIDTRTRTQFDMVHFPEAVHVPFERLRSAQKRSRADLRALLDGLVPEQQAKTLVICRRGVDSIAVTQWLVDSGVANAANVDGGYEAYALQVDPTFPMY